MLSAASANQSGSPHDPKQDANQNAVGTDTRIVRAAIHPALGIARIGNSKNEFYIGPEVTNLEPPQGRYRDATGAIKREVVRVR